MEVKGTLRWDIRLWNYFLKSWNSSTILWRHHLKIWWKRLKLVYQVQLAVKIFNSGTKITLVPEFFSDGGTSAFWNIDPRCEVNIPKLELSGQNLHLRCDFQLLEIAEGFDRWFDWLPHELLSRIPVFTKHH